jgi:hypothetical protein
VISKYSNFKEFVKKLLPISASTYKCEQIFSLFKSRFSRL